MERGSATRRRNGSRRAAPGTLLLAVSAGILFSGSMPAIQGAGEAGKGAGAPTLEETRLAMGKWIEQQKLLAKERNDWQQGREILLGRLELVKQEIATLGEKIAQVEGAVAEADRKRDELAVEHARLKSAGTRLGEAVARMEGEIRRLFVQLPEPLRARLQPLFERIPEDAATTRVSIAERFQNVLGILNEVNKANQEISVVYEVRELSDGKPAEVRTIYVGLAQAWYVSASHEAGVGRPGPDGWTFEPANALAGEVTRALEVSEGKQSPAFVPLPVRLR
jgi:FtsZ-binding cell division protein ZapB